MAVNFDAVLNLSKAGLIDPERMGYKDSLEIIKDESYKVQKSFVKIGWYLKHIRDNELYKEDGYSNIYECAADQLGYSQSTVSRFINICEKFSKNHNSPELDEKYAGFDKSQMIEMLPLSQEQIDEEVKPDMTVKQIRDIKTGRTTETNSSEEVKEGEECEENSIPGQTSIEKDFPEYMPSYPQVAVPDDDRTATESEVDTMDGDAVEGEYAMSQPGSQEFSDEDDKETKRKERKDQDYEMSLLRDMLDEAKDVLKNYRSFGDIPEKTVHKQKLLVGALANMVCELKDMQEKEENVVKTQQELLPILRNNDQRKQWLADYKSWGLWYRDDNIDVNYYKFDFIDGSRLIVAEYPQRFTYWSSKREDNFQYHLLEKNKEGYEKRYDEDYCHQSDSETYLIEFLKKIQKKG